MGLIPDNLTLPPKWRETLVREIVEHRKMAQASLLGGDKYAFTYAASVLERVMDELLKIEIGYGHGAATTTPKPEYTLDA